jgi:hypothetical protein
VNLNAFISANIPSYFARHSIMTVIACASMGGH